MSRRKSDKKKEIPIKPMNNGDGKIACYGRVGTESQVTGNKPGKLPDGVLPLGDGMLTTPFMSDKNPLRGSPHEAITKAVQMARDGSIPIGGGPIPMTDHANHIQGMVNEAIRGTLYEGKIKIVDIVPKMKEPVNCAGPQPGDNRTIMKMAAERAINEIGNAISQVTRNPLQMTTMDWAELDEVSAIAFALRNFVNS